MAVGDRVLAMPWLGGFASHVELAAGGVVPIPGALSYGQAAALVQSYGTMLFAFTKRTQVREGEWVLVLGAGGGIGLAAVDVARHLGARVIAAASSDEKLAAATAAGAEATIDYETEDLKARAREISGGGVDVVVDPVGDRFADPALRALGWMGRYLVIGFAGGRHPVAADQPGAAQQPHARRHRLGRLDDARRRRQPGAARRAHGSSPAPARCTRSSPPSTRSTTWCRPSPTSRTARSPARSSSSPSAARSRPDRAGRRRRAACSSRR